MRQDELLTGLATGIAQGVVEYLAERGWPLKFYQLEHFEHKEMSRIVDAEAPVLLDVLIEQGVGAEAWIEKGLSEWTAGATLGKGATSGRTPFAAAVIGAFEVSDVLWESTTAARMGRRSAARSDLMGLVDLWKQELNETSGPIVVSSLSGVYDLVPDPDHGWDRYFLFGPMLPIDREWRWESAAEEWLKERFPR